MSISRDKLRAHEPCSFDPASDDHKHTRPVTPEEFHQIATAEGYVKLDVDVEALREVIEAPPDPWKDDLTDQEIDTLWKVARQVLAALDGEAT